MNKLLRPSVLAIRETYDVPLRTLDHEISTIPNPIGGDACARVVGKLPCAGYRPVRGSTYCPACEEATERHLRARSEQVYIGPRKGNAWRQ